MPDLHAEFHDPHTAESSLLEDFLIEVDKTADVEAVHVAMRDALDLQPGQRLLDAGCGIGLEIARLATQHPDVRFTGLDQNPSLLESARSRATGANIDWVESTIEAADFPAGSFDAIRSERVLMYAAGSALGRAVDCLVTMLRPGGRMVLFELDYGAIVLPVGRHDEQVVRYLTSLLEQAMPEPLAGRRLPEELASRGMDDVTARAFAMTVSETVWHGIVERTLREALAADPAAPAEAYAWLDDHAAHLADVPLPVVFVGILTTARRPSRA